MSTDGRALGAAETAGPGDHPRPIRSVAPSGPVSSMARAEPVQPPAEGEVGLTGFRPRRCEVHKDSAAVLTTVDSAFVRILGWPAAEVVGRRAIVLVHPDDHQRAAATWIELLAHPGSQRRVRLRLRHRDGSWVWMEVTNHNRLHDPEYGDVVTELVDVSDEIAAQEALQASQSLLRALTEALPMGLLHFGPDRRIRYRNERVSRLLDHSRASTVDEQFASVLPADRPAVEQALTAVLAGQDADLEVRLRRARRCHLRLRPITEADGQIDGALLSVADITEDARLRDELRQRATYDALTQCLNRAAILDELEATLGRPETRTAGTAVIFFDVDHFKEINDKLGHGVGDQLLVAVARRLRAAARSEDLVGRFGGDEFLMVCRKIASPELALAVAGRIADGLGTPLQLAHLEMTPKASIGVAWSDREVDVDALVDRADIAMYESKRQRLGRPALYQQYPESAGDVADELFLLGFQLGDRALHHVADADQADQLAAVYHGQVPDPPVGHRLPDGRDVVAAPAGVDVHGHDRRDALGQQRGAVFVQPADDVALGDDAGDRAAVGGDHQGTEVVRGQLGQEGADGGVGGDGGHRAPGDLAGLAGGLAAEDVADQHRISLPTPEGRGRRAAGRVLF